MTGDEYGTELTVVEVLVVDGGTSLGARERQGERSRGNTAWTHNIAQQHIRTSHHTIHDMTHDMTHGTTRHDTTRHDIT